MKFTIGRAAFTAQLIDVSRAIPSKATIPILTGIKITATKEGITLIGSDAEISIESFLSVQDDSLGLEIEETGSIVVTARIFNDIVRKLPTTKVTIETNEQFILTATSGEAIFSLNGTDGHSYPRLPEIESDRKINLPTVLFKELISQTIFSASNQESRPVLTGVHLMMNEGHITGVATDSHRLSRRQIPVEFTTDQANFEAITIPKKTLNELERIVQDDQMIEMIVTEQQVIFLIDNLTIYSRLLEGNYPDTDRLLPSSHTTEIVLNADQFLHAIDRASLMSHQGKNNVVQLDITEDNIDLSVQGSSLGSANESISAKSITGEPIKISFNPDYMKDALRSFSGVDINVGFTSSVRPLLISALEKSETPNNELLQLLTPIRTH
ncbi:DNA polymerase III subunit beta [Ruoffia sp. FAM 24228]|uniref:DNA polymerase III subunit beta n=1 Tax=Ruoffia sp. FAM 24228 TaxID=3259517 RepID=UPI0038888863